MAEDKPQSTLDEIRAGVGDLSAIELFNNQILVGIWIRPEKTKGGIILTSKTQDEDRWQGKVAVVLKKGPTAFVDDGNVSFKGQDVSLGDWVVFKTSDGFPLDVNGVRCRVVEDVHLKAKVSDPATIY
jgi:co-chaperonin GroES (HSP10)